MTDHAKAEAYWARLHIASDRSPAVPLPPTVKRSGTFTGGGGARVSRGGFEEERRP